MAEHAGAPAAPEHNFTNRIVKIFLESNLSLILILLATIVGLAALGLTPREEDPQIVVPLADVYVNFPGHSAAEVEQLVATPLEKILYQIDGVEYVYSMSRERPGDHHGPLLRGRGPRAEPGQALQEDRREPGHRSAGRHRLGRQAGGDRRRARGDAHACQRQRRRHDAAPRGRGTDPAAGGRQGRVAGLRRGRPAAGGAGATWTPTAWPAYHVSPLELQRAIQAANVRQTAGDFRNDDQLIRVEAGEPFDRRPAIARSGGRRVRRPARVSQGRGQRRGRAGRSRQLRAPRLGAGPRVHEARILSRHGLGRPTRALAAASTRRIDASQSAVTIAIAKKKGSNAVWVAKAVLARGRRAARQRSCPTTWNWSSPATTA